MSPQETVETFIAAWNRGDGPAAFGMMAQDVVWHNIPMEPAVGIAGCQALMAGFPPIEGTEWTVHNIAANGNVVLTERTDKFLIGGIWRAIRVSGTFEINTEGKIAHWRDYFDMVEFQREFA